MEMKNITKMLNHASATYEKDDFYPLSLDSMIHFAETFEDDYYSIESNVSEYGIHVFHVYAKPYDSSGFLMIYVPDHNEVHYVVFDDPHDCAMQVNELLSKEQFIAFVSMMGSLSERVKK